LVGKLPVLQNGGVAFAVPAGSVADLRLGLVDTFKRVEVETGRTPATRLLALLFAPDGASLAREQVIPRLGQFHWRSRLAMDLFCAGYGRRGGSTDIDGTFRTVLDHGPDGEWLFSDRGFDDVRRYVETESGWRYSGEVDLLLVNARLDTEGWESLVDFQSGAEIRLANAIADQAVGSVAGLLERLFEYAEDNPDTASATIFAAKQAGKTIAGSLVDVVLGALPVDVRPLWKQGRHIRPLALALQVPQAVLRLDVDLGLDVVPVSKPAHGSSSPCCACSATQRAPTDHSATGSEGRS
jgi:hypothetical protein